MSCNAPHPARHRQGFAENAIEDGPAHARRASRVPRPAQLCSDFTLACLRGVEPASHQEEVLYRRFVRPGPKRSPGFARLRIAAGKSFEDFSAAILRRCAIRRREKNFDPIAGGEVDDSARAQSVTEGGEALGNVLLRDREASDLLRVRVAVRETDDPDLLHAAQQTTVRGAPKCHQIVTAA